MYNLPYFGDMKMQLTVYRDYIESNGKWRLFWNDLNNPGSGFQDESTVTGQPFFKTKKEAMRRGFEKYNIIAVKADW